MPRLAGVTSIAPQRKPKAAECSRCGGRNYEPSFRMCLTCRELTAASHAVWRETHREAGLCTECCERRKRGEYSVGAAHARGRIFMKCGDHLEYHRAWCEANYKSKRKRGLCTYGACKTRTRHYVCDEHAQRTAPAKRPPNTKPIKRIEPRQPSKAA